MAVVLGLLAAISYGSADFLGGMATKRNPRCPGCSHLAGPRFRSVPGGFATAPRGPAHGRGVAVGRPRRADRRRRPGVLVPRTGPRPDERRGPDDGGDRCRHARGLRSRHRGAALDASARGYRPGHPCHRFGVVRAATQRPGSLRQGRPSVRVRQRSVFSTRSSRGSPSGCSLSPWPDRARTPEPTRCWRRGSCPS